MSSGNDEIKKGSIEILEALHRVRLAETRMRAMSFTSAASAGKRFVKNVAGIDSATPLPQVRRQRPRSARFPVEQSLEKHLASHHLLNWYSPIARLTSRRFHNFTS
jgi:hypothetical protein